VEKIQKALEKSLRSQDPDAGLPPPANRGTGAGAGGPAGAGSGGAAASSAGLRALNGARAANARTKGARAANAANGGETLKIEYTQTRVVHPPKRRLARSRLIAGNEDHMLADTFRILRTRVLNRMDTCGYRTLGIASAVGREGKTLIACNLAISMAKILTRSVLLVDLDMRSPSVHRYFGIDPRPGLEAYLRRNVELSQCLVNPGIERLVLLPTSRSVRNSSELITTPRMIDLARELRETYPDRLIVYDLPPVLRTDDALAFMKYVDCALLVATEGRTREDDLQKLVGLMDDYPVIGSVLNRSSEKPQRYYGSRY
jgi:capsular exopolysaccharide synthesis family protein